MLKEDEVFRIAIMVEIATILTGEEAQVVAAKKFSWQHFTLFWITATKLLLKGLVACFDYKTDSWFISNSATSIQCFQLSCSVARVNLLSSY